MPAKKAATSKKPARRPKPAAEPTLHQLRVTLRGSSPPIWRRFVVPSEVDLSTLHALLQAVMDWANAHTHVFYAQGRRFSDPELQLESFEGDEPMIDEHEARLEQLAPKAGDSLVYEYDLGDGWTHDIVVEEVREVDAGPLLWCLDGARACPPDDCGGIPGYEQMLVALASNEQPRHDETLEWLGGDFDPERFDVRVVNRELARWVLTRA